ncbi:MAG: hypothetical protein O2894_12540 [Planctomycetota bacterium]|nr:hypothetical protein [Planctomycetota bacterium]
MRSLRPSPHRPPARHAEQGFGLVEVALALLVIAIATMGSVSWTLSGMRLDAATREEADATDALREVLEELQATPFEEVFARFNTLPEDDPEGPGTAVGGRVVLGLTGDVKALVGVPRSDGLTGGSVGEPPRRAVQRAVALSVDIAFPTDGSGRLVESAMGADWGDGAIDIDGDGEITDEATISGYVLLPVRVRITWDGGGGTRTLEHVRLLTRRVRAGGE